MAYSRYFGRDVFTNSDPKYREAFFNEKGIKQIEQYETPIMGYPTMDQMETLTNLAITWAASSRLYNLAEEFYGDPQYWWVIAWYNQKPTEAHFNIGDIVYIPTPVDRVLELF